MNIITKSRNNIEEVCFWVNATLNCNLRCNHCYISEKELSDKTIMKKEEILNNYKIMRKFVNIVSSNKKYNHIKSIEMQIFGGELFLIQDKDYINFLFEENYKFMKFVEEETRLIFKTEVTSNLLLNLKEDYIENFSNIFKKYNVYKKDSFIFNTSFENDTNRFKNKEKLNLWKKNIEIFKKVGIETGLSLVLTKGMTELINNQENEFKDLLSLFNHETFINFFEPSKETGVENINNLLPNYEELIKSIKNLIKLYNNNYNLAATFLEESFTFEENFELNLAFKPNNRLTAMNYLVTQENDFNTNKNYNDEYLKIFIDKSIKNLIDNTLDRVRSNDKCLNCKYIEECLGGVNYNSLYKDKYCNGFFELREEENK